MSRVRRLVHHLAAIVLLAALPACSLIPTSGPVEQSTPSPAGAGVGPRVDIQPASPPPNGSPDQIAAGFLSAVSSNNAGRFAVARQYLTPQAAGQWKPADSVTIYASSGDGPIVVQDTAVTLQIPVVGNLDSAGRYTAGNQPRFSHDFRMTRGVDGQWRIDDPGVGIFISQATFQRSYRTVPLYFFDYSMQRLVTDTLYMNWADATPTAAVQALLNGPSTWLSTAVGTVAPPQTKLVLPSVPVVAGIASVSLNEPVLGLSDTQRVQLAAQLLWTLQAFSVTGLRVDVDGSPLKISGQDEDGVIHAEAVSSYEPMTSAASQDVFGLMQDGSVVKVSMSPGDMPKPVPGPLGLPGLGATQLAVAADGTTVALTSPQPPEGGPAVLWVGSAINGLAPRQLLQGADFTRPQVTTQGTWVIDRKTDPAVPQLYLVDAGGVAQHVPLPDLGGDSVVAFRVGPDKTRLVVVAMSGSQPLVGMMRISSVAPLTVDGWQPLVVNTDRGALKSVLDVGWLSATQVALLATTVQNDSSSVFHMDVDAAFVTSMGPLSGEMPVSMAVQPRASGTTALAVTATGAVRHYEDTTRWTVLAAGLTSVALPG